MTRLAPADPAAPALLAAALILGGCATGSPPNLVRAQPIATPPEPVALAPFAEAEAAGEEIFPVGPRLTAVPTPVPEIGAPEARVEAANAAARVEPSGADYALAAQVYAYAPHALYQVYATPGRVTDIALQPGETLSGEGAIAAGDTVRWIIGESVSGAGADARTHILLKPTRPDLATNLIIHTDRRTYLLELQARADVYMASIAWRYPLDEARALNRAARERDERRREPTVDLSDLNFNYRITGDAAPWRPVRVFDDGARVFIEFSEAIDTAALPPLFLRPRDSAVGSLVNYRVQGRRILVDRLFDRAELRLVQGRREQVVSIERAGGRR